MGTWILIVRLFGLIIGFVLGLEEVVVFWEEGVVVGRYGVTEVLISIWVSFFRF